ncbi:MAG: type II toxin-antitoxin system Phd/YefM family antitoxin [Pyrinomonadaceae bacterium]
MTKTVNISKSLNSIQSVIALTKNGDDVVIEENGKPVAKVTPIADTKKVTAKQRFLGLGKGKAYGYFMSDDFNDELPDEFWAFDENDL